MRRTLSWIVTLALSAIGAVAAPIALHPAHAGQAGRVTSDYTLLRAKPHGFVIGQAYRGQGVTVQQAPQEGYQWARIGNNFNDCAWIFQGAVKTTGSAGDSCRHDNRGISESRFARFIALGGDTAGNPANGTDGLPAHIDVTGPNCAAKHGDHTPAFGNVNAIEGTTSAKDHLFLVPHGHPVLWRYLTRDYQWFMVRDPSRGPTDGTGAPSWYYVYSGCVVPDQIDPHRFIP